jgi:methylenetetrahydrofolate dehydrogenase (NADP+)/methenyltetrahydrofolate cyclohydrolase
LAQIIDGKLVADVVKNEVKQKAHDFAARHGVKPGLATVLVGEDAASQVYVRNKIKATEACGLKSFHCNLDAKISQNDLLKQVYDLNANPEVHGILVQLPLPKQIQSEVILNAIDPKKDVDGFHPQNLGRLVIGQPTLQPCTPFGVMRLLEHYKIDVSGKNAVIVGRSNIVGKPMALMLLAAHATVTIAHSRTQDLPKIIGAADIVVAALGKSEFVKGSWIGSGAVVIDVGINRKADGKLCGDVEFVVAQEKASWITPVPGGVGPMTIAILMQNALVAAEKA